MSARLSPNPTPFHAPIRLIEELSESTQSLETVFYCAEDLAVSDSVGANADGRSHDGSAIDRPGNRSALEPLRVAAQSASKLGRTVERNLVHPPMAIIAWPVAPGSEGWSVLVQAYATPDTLIKNRAIAEGTLAEIRLWFSDPDSNRPFLSHNDTASSFPDEREAEPLSDGRGENLLAALLACPHLEDLSLFVVRWLKARLDAESVTLATRLPHQKFCLKATSNGRFDPRSLLCVRTQQRMEEARRRNATSCEKRDESSPHELWLLRSQEGEPVVALELGGIRDSSVSDNTIPEFLKELEPSIAEIFLLRLRQEEKWTQQLLAYLRERVSSKKSRWILSIAAIATLLLLIPVPYYVSCESVLEPVVRRYVSAPFEGILLECHVQPGDTIRSGELLAELDGRTLRLERASLLSDLEQAKKRRDTAQVTERTADAQIASLEIERLNNEVSRIDRKIGDLRICSETDGVVLSGDWKRQEGTPLTIGMNLFEIAPLDRMLVEISIPDSHIELVQSSSLTWTEWDAIDIPVLRSKLESIEPKAEIRNDDNVFVGTITVENANGFLRPGMKGTTKIQANSRSLAWILFHRPWSVARKWLPW